MSKQSVAELGSLLDAATDGATRLALLRRLGRRGREAGEVASQVAACLGDPDEAVAMAACGVFKSCSYAVTEAIQGRLLDLIMDPTRSNKLRAEAAWALSMTVERAGPLEPRIREAIAVAPKAALQHMGELLSGLSLEGLDVVLDLFEGAPATIYNALYNRRGQLVSRRERIEELTRHKKPAVRLNAVKLIGRMGPACGPSLPALCAVLRNDSEKDEVRDAAVHACLDLRRHARSPEVAAALVHLVQASTLPKVHQFYATYFMQRALEEQGPPMIALLEPLAEHPDGHVRRAVVGVVTAIKNRTGEAGFEDYNTVDEEVAAIGQTKLDPEELLPETKADAPAAKSPAPVDVDDEEPEEDDEEEDDNEDGDDDDEAEDGPEHRIAAGDDAGAALILAGLRDPDPRVRYAAAEKLEDYTPAGVQHRGIADRLLELVRTTTAEAELGQMVEALASLPPDYPGVLDELRKALTHPRERIRWSACHAAKDMGPGAAPVQADVLTLALRRLGGEDTEYPSWTFRFDPRSDALKALGAINRPTAEVTEALQGVVEVRPSAGFSDEWMIWAQAAELLVKWGAFTPTLRARLVELLDSSDANDREYAARICGQEGWKRSPAPDVAEALAARLKKERSQRVKREIIRGLRSHGNHAESAVKALEGLAKKGDEQAVRSLLSIQPGNLVGIEFLKAHLKQKLDSHAVHLIGEFPAAVRASRELLVRLMESAQAKGILQVLVATLLEENGLGDDNTRKIIVSAAQPKNPMKLPTWQVNAVAKLRQRKGW
ncbi:hypothetical protein GC173_02300 [bacterium]|nr:hypothetical protein [bacterium]